MVIEPLIRQVNLGFCKNSIGFCRKIPEAVKVAPSYERNVALVSGL